MGLLPARELKGNILEHDGLCKCLRKQPVSNVLNLPKKVQSADPDLKTPSCDGLPHVGEDDLAPVNNLTQLLSLDLTACIRVTDASIIASFRFCQLRSLKLDMNQMVTDRGIASICRNNLSLEELSINQCSKVTESGISAVICYLPRIAKLSMANNDCVTDEHLASMGQHCPCLRKLNVSLCSRVSQAAVEKLEKSYKHYVQVEKRLIGTDTMPL